MPEVLFGFNAREIKRGAQEAEHALDGVSTSAERSEKNINVLESRLTSFAKTASAAFAGVKRADLAKSATLTAAKYEMAGVSMYQVGKNAGYSQKELDSYTRSLEKTGIAMMESRQLVTQLASAQVDLSNTSKLARVAQDAAVIGGVNSTQAFERLTLGVIKSDAQILRSIGINVNWEASYQKMADSLHNST
jgi:hypothetical protein